jgi:hypothetical protein
MKNDIWPGCSFWAGGREFRYTISTNSFVESSKYKQESNNMSNRKQWSFHTDVPEYKIDFKEIRKDLSSSHPIALVEVNGEKEWKGYVLVHDSILDKAELLRDTSEGLAEAYMNECITVFEPSDFDYWTEWATEIKNAEWPEEVKNKATVKVTLKRV